MSVVLAVGLGTVPGCGDDGSGDDDGGGTSAATGTSAGTGMTSGDLTSTGGGGSGSGGGGSGSDGTASSSATEGTTAGDGTTASETTAGACEETVGPDDGAQSSSCDECAEGELCMELTEHAGPADGGGPMVTYYCFPFPLCCEAEADCDCAGLLCPDAGVGGESSCDAADGILYCDVAYP